MSLFELVLAVLTSSSIQVIIAPLVQVNLESPSQTGSNKLDRVSLGSGQSLGRVMGEHGSGTIPRRQLGKGEFTSPAMAPRARGAPGTGLDGN